MPSAVRKRGDAAAIAVRAKVTSKGQITLPVALRRRLGVKAGDSLLFRTKGKDVVMEPQGRRSAFEEYRGIGTNGAGNSKQAILNWVREFRGDL